MSFRNNNLVENLRQIRKYCAKGRLEIPEGRSWDERTGIYFVETTSQEDNENKRARFTTYYNYGIIKHMRVGEVIVDANGIQAKLLPDFGGQHSVSNLNKLIKAIQENFDDPSRASLMPPSEINSAEDKPKNKM